MSETHNAKNILRFAKSHGYLSPIWLLPHSDSGSVQRAFQELDSFLRTSYLDGRFREASLADIDSFIWSLEKSYAFDGWDGIAPLLIGSDLKRKVVIPEIHI